MLLVGRMHAGEGEKGQRELIAAMPRITEQVPQAQLVLVGEGSDRAALCALAAASPARAAIFLPGSISHAALRALYANCYAYVMPSRQEGFGLVYLEAMAYAKPCVACRDDGGADVVLDGETGLLLDQPVEIDDLARQLVELLSDPNRATQLGAAGNRRLLGRFTAEAYRARLERLLNPMITRRG